MKCKDCEKDAPEHLFGLCKTCYDRRLEESLKRMEGNGEKEERRKEWERRRR